MTYSFKKPFDLKSSPRVVSFTGFVRNMSIPLSNASVCASSDDRPDRAIMGRGWSFSCASSDRIRLVASKPSITGIEMSIKIHRYDRGV